MLPKIIIPTYSDKDRYRFVSSSWDGYYKPNNIYPKLLLNDKWLIKPSMIWDEDVCSLVTCQFHDNGEDKLYYFAPECPSQLILNSTQSDQLDHCVKIPPIS